MKELFEIQIQEGRLGVENLKLTAVLNDSYRESMTQLSMMKDKLLFPLYDHIIWIESIKDFIERIKGKIALRIKLQCETITSIDQNLQVNHQINSIQTEIDNAFKGLEEEW